MSIRVENLNYTYAQGTAYQSVALDNVNFSIEDGEFVGIIGHTGSGKSTLLMHLNGLLSPQSGKIFIGDTEITDSSTKMVDIRRKVGLVFQYPEYQLFEETVAKDVGFGPKNLGLQEDDITERVCSAISAVGLDYDELSERSPFELSGGQKRRVAIAGVLAMEPEVLILDEPTAGLDPKAREEVMDTIVKIHKERGNITVLVSHNMDDIAKYSDKVIVMDDGKILMVGTAYEVFSQRELLSSRGLGMPCIMELASKLKERGHDVPGKVMNIDEAECMLLDILKAKGR